MFEMILKSCLKMFTTLHVINSQCQWSQVSWPAMLNNHKIEVLHEMKPESFTSIIIKTSQMSITSKSDLIQNKVKCVLLKVVTILSKYRYKCWMCDRNFQTRGP